jgi:hypothetical protein
MKSSATEQKETTSNKQTQPYEPKHAIICNRNGIKIYYVPVDNFSGKITIEDNGKFRHGATRYKAQGQKFTKTDKMWWKVVESLYTQEYNKLPDELKVEKPVMIEFEIIAMLNGKQIQII